MTVVTDSSQLRKAFLGFLLCAHLGKDNDDSWHNDTAGTDILIDPEDLPEMGPDGEPGTRTQPARDRGKKRKNEDRGSPGDDDNRQSSYNPQSSSRDRGITAREAAPPGEKNIPTHLIKALSPESVRTCARRTPECMHTHKTLEADKL